MDELATKRAAEMLLRAHVDAAPLKELPEDCRPATPAEGHALQDRLLAMLGEEVVGYKVAITPQGDTLRGAILASRLHDSPARLGSETLSPFGVEAEIAFRLNAGLPPRDRDYTRAEIAEAVTAMPAIEVVSTRFSDYTETPVLHRLGDCMSNGALIIGAERRDWREFDFETITVRLTLNNKAVVSSKGGHQNADPLLPAVALANAFRHGKGLDAGLILTTGTFTGLTIAGPRTTVNVGFDDFGEAEIHFE